MQHNRSRNTGPEVRLRQALWAAGVRGWRLHRRNLPGKPDLSFGRVKLALFVHGCFWHLCPACDAKRNLRPTANAEYWQAKRVANRERDALVEAKLKEMGWRVLPIWECEIKADLALVVQRVQMELLSSHPQPFGISE